jgi:hypothetical protein
MGLGILPEIFGEVIGREIIQGRMNSCGVVEAVDSAGDRLAGLNPSLVGGGGFLALLEQFNLTLRIPIMFEPS